MKPLIKSFLVSLFLLVISGYGIANEYCGYWGGDKGQGSVAYDITHNSNHGSLEGGTSWTADSVAGGALAFDGDDDYVDCGTASSLNITTQLSIEVWVKRQGIGAGTGTMDGIVTKGGYNKGYQINFNETNEKVYFYLYTSTGYTAIIGNVIPLNEFQHIVATYDGSFMKLYQNGVETASISKAGAIVNFSKNFYIGKSSWDCFNGIIDKVRVYNGVLSEQKIGEHYNNEKILGNWKFDEGSENTAYDLSGNGNNGIRNGASWTTLAYAGSALDFDGDNDYVDCGSSLILNNTEGIIIDVWVKRQGEGAGAGTWDGIVSKGGYSMGYQLLFFESDDKVYLYINTARGYTSVAGKEIPLDEFQHIVAKYDGETMEIFQDGNRTSSKPWSGEITNFLSNFYIGKSSGFDCFNGIIDEVKISPIDKRIELGYQPPNQAANAYLNDIVIIYGNGNNPQCDWSADDFSHLVTHLNAQGDPDDWFFDGFLFCSLWSNNNRGFDVGFGTGPANKTDWQWYADKIFTSGQDLVALNTAVGIGEILLSEQRIAKAIIMIPYPIPSQTGFGTVDGDSLDFSEYADRLIAVKWWIDMIKDKWDNSTYENVELAGFYWIRETIDLTINDNQLIIETNDYIHDMGLKSFWIPQYTAKCIEEWKQLGFDSVQQQPNYMFNDVGDSRLYDVAQRARTYGTGVEVELGPCSDPVIPLTSQIQIDKYIDYLDAGKTAGFMNQSIITYYFGNSNLKIMYDDVNLRYIYNKTYDFAKGTY